MSLQVDGEVPILGGSIRRGQWKRIAHKGMVFDTAPGTKLRWSVGLFLFLEEFRAAQKRLQPLLRFGCPSVRWQPPVTGLVKMNTNVALDVSNQLVGVGVAFRNHLGQVLGFRGSK
ncbi:hypothetical protein ACOSP7_006607 [Xanthoceras sorbifolium]